MRRPSIVIEMAASKNLNLMKTNLLKGYTKVSLSRRNLPETKRKYELNLFGNVLSSRGNLNTRQVFKLVQPSPCMRNTRIDNEF